MRSPLYLGLDVGTQGAKGVVVDAERSAVVARASSAYGLIEGLPPGAAEQHPDTWARALREIAAALRDRLGPALDSLAGIGVSGQQHGLVVLDARGEVVRPAKLWCDTSTAAEADELSRELGSAVPCGFTAPKIRWLARREPESWRRTRRVLLPHDWVNLKLTGVAAMEPGDASGTGFFEVAQRRFDARAVDLVDPALAEKLPPLVESGAPLGEVSREGARWLGLAESAAGALVSTGGGDNMMSAVGAGATREGVAVLSLGTSATVFARSPRPIVDREGWIAPFCDSTGGFLPLLCTMNATGVLEEVRAAFGASFGELEREARDVEPGCGGLAVLPYLSGERAPNLPLASGALLGIRPGSLRRGRVYRAALEATALVLAWGVERMRALGLAISEVRAVGGGARSELWLSILSDCLEARAQRLEESESAAFGAALHALWTDRRRGDPSLAADAVTRRFVRVAGSAVEPDAARSGLYRELGRELRDRTRALFG